MTYDQALSKMKSHNPLLNFIDLNLSDYQDGFDVLKVIKHKV
jgi:hypothetical protein